MSQSYRILVSSHSDFIYTLSFHPTSNSLHLEHKTHTGYHPSWITSSPHDKSLIFAGLEHPEGKIVILKFENGKGTLQKTISSGGRDPCSLLATEKELFVANVRSISLAMQLANSILLVLRRWYSRCSHLAWPAIFSGIVP